MERAVIAKVAVAAAPYSIDKPYDYLIPEPLLETVRPGVRVTVPFGRGNRGSEGIVLTREDGEKTPGLKAIAAALDSEPVLDGEGIALALFLRQRYFCTMYEAARTILPAGLWYQVREVWRLAEGLDRAQAEELAGNVRGAPGVLDVLFASGGSAELKTLKAACGDGIGETLRALCRKKVLVLETETSRKINDKLRRMAELTVDAEDALDEAERKKRSAPVRSEVLRLLASTGRVAVRDLC